MAQQKTNSKVDIVAIRERMAMSNPIEDHMTLQFWAALQRKDAGAVRNLINDGIDVNLPDRNGMTPILMAAYVDSTDIVVALLRSGSSVNSVNNAGQTALCLAAKNGNLEIVRELLRHNCKVNAMSKFSGMTALHEASQKGHHRIVLALLDHGADVNSLDKINKTAEFYASNQETKDAFKAYKLRYPERVINMRVEESYTAGDSELDEILKKYSGDTSEKDKKASDAVEKNLDEIFTPFKFDKVYPKSEPKEYVFNFEKEVAKQPPIKNGIAESKVPVPEVDTSDSTDSTKTKPEQKDLSSETFKKHKERMKMNVFERLTQK